jgi:hypothetical protein
MKFRLVGCLLFLSASASAAPVAPPSATPAMPPAPSQQQVTVTLPVPYWQLIAGAIQRSDVLTARQAADLLAAISAQIHQQETAKK